MSKLCGLGEWVSGPVHVSMCVCNSVSEFEHIFGSSESAFVIWDTDNNGLIDSLELFSGITLFSDTKFEDKIRCIN